MATMKIIVVRIIRIYLKENVFFVKFHHFLAACEPDEFPCVKSGKCIKLSQRCNGIPDECFDQTNLDELHCQGMYS